jgi:predicted RND superfamily exporter protein
VARPFTEADGTRGLLVYLEPHSSRSIWDAHYLIEWAESFRVTELADGSKIEGSGRSVIFADMIMAIIEDAPKAILASLVGTMALVLAAFRGRRSALWVMGSVLLGFVWTLGVMAVARSRFAAPGGGFALEAMKLNFLNFIALPITLGVGSDYAVNVMKRYELDGSDDMTHVIVETGGAVVLCSLTTMLGYLALTLSVNLGIRSFGFVAATGEVACLLTAVVVLPAALTWLRRARKASNLATEEVSDHRGPVDPHGPQ